ncbi:hypothetical protein D3C71_1510100 [compost metagenome]
MQVEQRSITLQHQAADYFGHAIFFLILQGGTHLVALSHALFFITCDTGNPLGADVLNTEQVVDDLAACQRCLARQALFVVPLIAEMSIATDGTQQSLFGNNPSLVGALIAHT